MDVEVAFPKFATGNYLYVSGGDIAAVSLTVMKYMSFGYRRSIPYISIMQWNRGHSAFPSKDNLKEKDAAEKGGGAL